MKSQLMTAPRTLIEKWRNVLPTFWHHEGALLQWTQIETGMTAVLLDRRTTASRSSLKMFGKAWVAAVRNSLERHSNLITSEPVGTLEPTR